MVKKYVKKKCILFSSFLALAFSCIYFFQVFPSESASNDGIILEKSGSNCEIDLFYRQYENGIPLSMNSTVSLDKLPAEYEGAELILVNFTNSIEKRMKKSEVYHIPEDGVYGLFVFMNNDDQNEWISATSFMSIGSEYTTDHSNIRYLDH